MALYSLKSNLADRCAIPICSETTKSLLEKRERLSDFFTIIPNKSVRRMEWSIDYDGTIGLTACLNSEIPERMLVRISRSIQLPLAARQQAMAMLDLRCWRHTVRVDSRSGLSLYIERDWEPHILRALCSWFDSSQTLVESALEFVSRSSFVVAIVGIHWQQQMKPRLRLYVVANPAPRCWTTCAEELSDLIDMIQGGCDAFYVQRLLSKPRRACLINLEALDNHVGIKMELPDVSRSELDFLLNSRKPSITLGPLLPSSHDKLTYLGIRFRYGKPVSSTLYFNAPLGG